VTDQEGDRDIGKLLLEAAQQGRKDVFARNGARAHGQLAHELSLELVHGLSRFALELEDARGVGDEELARARRFRAAPEAIGQPRRRWRRWFARRAARGGASHARSRRSGRRRPSSPRGGTSRTHLRTDCSGTRRSAWWLRAVAFVRLSRAPARAYWPPRWT